MSNGESGHASPPRHDISTSAAVETRTTGMQSGVFEYAEWFYKGDADDDVVTGGGSTNSSSTHSFAVEDAEEGTQGAETRDAADDGSDASVSAPASSKTGEQDFTLASGSSTSEEFAVAKSASETSVSPTPVVATSPVGDISISTAGWRTPILSNLDLSSLSDDVDQYVTTRLALTPSEEEDRRRFVDRIRELLKSTISPHVTLRVHGSFVTKLALRESDIDFLVANYSPMQPLEAIDKATLALLQFTSEGESPAKHPPSQSDVSVLSRAGAPQGTFVPKHEGEVFTVQTIVFTRVPIIKVTEKKTGIKGDLSFGGGHHDASFNLIKRMLSRHRHARVLLLFMKNLLKDAGMGENAQGGLSSFALYLMAMHFFDVRFGPNGTPLEMTPPAQEHEGASDLQLGLRHALGHSPPQHVCDKIESFLNEQATTENTLTTPTEEPIFEEDPRSAGEVLFLFCAYYSEFEYEKKGIVFHTSGASYIIPKPESARDRRSTSCFHMTSPFDPAYDITARVSCMTAFRCLCHLVANTIFMHSSMRILSLQSLLSVVRNCYPDGPEPFEDTVSRVVNVFSTIQSDFYRFQSRQMHMASHHMHSQHGHHHHHHQQNMHQAMAPKPYFQPPQPAHLHYHVHRDPTMGVDVRRADHSPAAEPQPNGAGAPAQASQDLSTGTQTVHKTVTATTQTHHHHVMHPVLVPTPACEGVYTPPPHFYFAQQLQPPHHGHHHHHHHHHHYYPPYAHGYHAPFSQFSKPRRGMMVTGGPMGVVHAMHHGVPPQQTHPMPLPNLQMHVPAAPVSPPQPAVSAADVGGPSMTRGRGKAPSQRQSPLHVPLPSPTFVTAVPQRPNSSTSTPVAPSTESLTAKVRPASGGAPFPSQPETKSVESQKYIPPCRKNLVEKSKEADDSLPER